MKKVLILTAGYGEGHNAAARGLLAGFEHVGGASAEVVDIFPEAFGEFYERTRQDYVRIIDRAPHLWAAFYGMLDRTPLVHVIAAALRKSEAILERFLREHQPAAVVSTYPIYNYLLNRIRARKGWSFPQFTVVTDSISVNSVWFRCKTDLFFVPNEDTARTMERAGVSKDKLATLGFPVFPRFALERPDRSPAGDGQPRRVLFMINAGRDRAPALVERLLRLPGMELTVTAGRDEALKQAVQNAADRAGQKITLHGWTTQMPELLMANHVLIGKAGGASVQETIAARTPMIITKIVPGQEEGNAQLLIENNCGQLAETPDAIADCIENLFANDGKRWREWEANITKISRPDASLRIAETVVQRI